MSGADMLQSKDPAFKLFGRKIPVPDTQIPANADSKDSGNGTMKVEIGGLNKYNCREPAKLSASGREKEENQAAVNVNEALESSRLKEDKAETNDSNQENVSKKPERILPCPRCNSFETKFCYFNNYNVNQPRHFCKNCQRYWTAGGTMRNVPIGAGRRKNKHLASQYCQILVSSDGMPVNRVENSESANHQFISSAESKTALKPSAGNGMLLKFGSEAPLCKSMETLLNLGDRKRCVEMSSVTCADNEEVPSSCKSSMTASSAQGGEQPESMMQREQVNFPGSCTELRAPQPLPCYPVPPWVFPWSPSWKNVASTASTQHSSGEACITNSNNPNQVQWCPAPIVAVPGFCPPNIPLQFVPASYWDCVPVWAGTGNSSLKGSNGCLSPSSSTSTGCCSGNGSPTLGKHSREPNFTEEEKAENCILVPKTLRISDTNKSSKILKWATSDLQPDQKDLISSGAVLKTFASKAEEKDHVPDATYILEANPAALSRSHTFQESS